MKKLWLFVGAILIVGFAGQPTPAQEKNIKLDVVKFDGLCQEVNKHKGKVIVVDFWSNTCVPCIQGFPKLVKLHKKYSAKGLHIITVNTDTADKKEIETAKGWLSKAKMPTQNLLLDENYLVLGEKLRVEGVPSVYVFNRQGQWRHFADGVSPDELEKLIVKFLNEKK
ncbi:MAG: TlpA family protein disulfide reductase [Gemmataceae bacterium]